MKFQERLEQITDNVDTQAKIRQLVETMVKLERGRCWKIVRQEGIRIPKGSGCISCDMQKRITNGPGLE